MHELSFAKSIFKTVNGHARKQRAQKVRGIIIETNTQSGIEEEPLQMYWEHLCKSSPVLSGSRIEVKMRASLFRCISCNLAFKTLKGSDLVPCPSCSSLRIIPTEDAIVKVVSITIESKDK